MTTSWRGGTWKGVRAGLAMGMILAAASVPAREPVPAADEVASKVEEYMAARVKRDDFSGSILIARDGQAVVRQGYGLANREHDVPNSPATKFRLGSITKQFTAMAVLILQERGKLKVHDRLRLHLPDAPESWSEITLHHLLTHTSGIPNYTSFPEFPKLLPNRLSLEELIGLFRDRPLEFRPGEKFSYSNSGYVVLGAVIEKASGRNYAAFLKEAILDPAGMRDTGYDNPIPILKHRAAGYTRRLGVVLTHSDYVDMSLPHAAGALYSTVDDLLKWDRVLESELLVSRKSLEAMFTPYLEGYGYGWVIDEVAGAKRYAHGGGIQGFVTSIERYPEWGLLVVGLSNLETSAIGPITNDLAAIALGRRYVIPRIPKAVSLEPAVLAALVGEYETEVAGKGKRLIVVAREGDRLTCQPQGKAKLVLFPESESTFYVPGADAEASFVKDQAGRVARLVLLQNGVEVVARKVVSSVGKREEAVVSPEAPPAGGDSAP